MDLIRNKYSIYEYIGRVVAWAKGSFARAMTAVEIDLEAINKPVEFALKNQADPRNACHLWAIMVRHAYWICLNPMVEALPDGSWPDQGPDIPGELVRLYPDFNGCKVYLYVCEGSDPRSGLFLLDDDQSSSTILKQISLASFRHILAQIAENEHCSERLWLKALCEEKPLSKQRRDQIYEEHHEGEARHLIRLIEMVHAGNWKESPVSVDFLREKIQEEDTRTP